MTYCAICTSERGPFTAQPLGRNNALVPVCAACDEPIFTRTGPERGWEPSGGPLHQSELTAAMRRVMGDAEYERQTEFEDAYGRKGAHALGDDEYAIRDFHFETQRRHHTQAGYANRTSAERVRGRTTKR